MVSVVRSECAGHGRFRVLFIISMVAFATMMLTPKSSSAATYSSKIELPAIRISVQEMQRALDDAAHFVESGGGNNETLWERVRLGDGVTLSSIDGHKVATGSLRRNLPITDFGYSVQLKQEAPVMSIDISMNDFSRTIEVRGSSSIDVDAVVASLREDLVPFYATLGGRGARVALFVIYAALVTSSLYFLVLWAVYKTRKFLIPLLIVAGTAALILILPKDALSGFWLISGDPRLFVIYAPEIGALGLLLAIVGSPIAYVLSSKQEQRNDVLGEVDLEREYQACHAKVMTQLVNRGDLRAIKMEHGVISHSGDELFDAVFEWSDRRVAVSTFRTNTLRRGMQLFIANAAVELAANHVQKILVIVFKGENDEFLRLAALNQIGLYREELMKGFSVFVIDPSTAASDAAHIRLE